MKRTILIDADVVAYQCASRLEVATEWAPGHWTWHVSFDAVCDAVETAIIGMKEKLEADRAILCLSDSKANFRKDVLPSYKTHRATVKKPLVLLAVKDWLVENMGAVLVPGLEGDDVLGILATRPGRDEKIIVSLDKDLKTIPGKYVRTRAVIGEDGAEIVGAWDIQEVTEDAADFWFLSQTLMGDPTDGYTGCPGVGPKTVGKIITEGDPFEDNWAKVVAHYQKKGLGPEEAITQARCARILRASDYDFDSKKVILWNPPAPA